MNEDKTSQTRKIKIYDIIIDDKCVLNKGYKELITFESEDSMWVVEDVDVTIRVDKDKTICINNGDSWVYINEGMISLLEEAILELKKLIEKSK